MDIALNTDFVKSTGSPELFLRLMSEAGFNHLHWCHQWNTDFIYSSHEFAVYKKWLKQYGIKLLDIHGSDGMEKCWYSRVEYQRKAGVELVANRIQMMHELEGIGSLMMHIPFYSFAYTPSADEKQAIVDKFEALKRSIDELMPLLEKYNVRIAVENLANDTFENIAELMNIYPEKYLGITYDSGHANIQTAKGADLMEKWKHRLQALHLHDNDCSGDLHQPPFYGTVDWEKCAKMIATSSYTDRPLSFELSIRNTPFMSKRIAETLDEKSIRGFLADAYTRCCKTAQMAEDLRS